MKIIKSNKFCAVLILTIVLLTIISAIGFGYAKYTNTVIADTITVKAVSYPWVDYKNKTGNHPQNIIDYATNNYIYYNTTLAQSYHDKLNIPIHRLVPGEWYILTFSEEITDHGKDIFNPTTGIYGCTVRGEAQSEHNFKSMISLTAGNDYFVWTSSDGKYDDDEYVPASNKSIVFKATSETMMWVWDISKPKDGQLQTFYIENLQVKPLHLPKEGPRINFPETTLYGFYNKSAVGNEHEGENGGIGGDGISTFKTYADSTSLLMSLVGQKDYEKINIPINGLTAGNKYRIDYTASLTMMNKSKNMFIDHGFGYMIGDSENKNTSSPDLRNVSGFVNLTNAKDEVTDGYWNGSGSFTFNATQENHYWIWDASGTTNEKYFLKYMNFNNTSITHVIPVNLILANMTANRSDDAEEGNDYSVVLTPAEGYNLPASVKVTIGGNAVTVYTNGTGNPDGYSFDASTKTLTISGELLTKEVSSFTIEAEGNMPSVFAQVVRKLNKN